MDAKPRKAAPIALQERDLALLRSLFESRVMTAAHAAALHFDGKAEAAKKRLQTLKAAGLVGERPRRAASEPAVLVLGAKGLSLLRDHGVLAEYPALGSGPLARRSGASDLTIRHELDVMDVKAAVCSALRGSPTLSIAEFCTWPKLLEFETVSFGGTATVVRPDGFLRVHEREADDGLYEHAFFVEVDRSTETLDTLAAKAAGYLDFYRSGGFAERCGAPRSAFREYPFRVLMVFKTAERRNNMAERLLRGDPPILTQVALATLDDVRRDPFGKVWIRPLDYREATAGTRYDAAGAAVRPPYRRDAARDAFVERHAAKHALLTS